MNWKKLFRNLVIGGAALGGGVLATQVTVGCSDSTAPPGDVARIGAADAAPDVPRIGPDPGDSTVDTAADAAAEGASDAPSDVNAETSG